MDQIIEAIAKLQPFRSFFKLLGFSDELSTLFSVVLIVVLTAMATRFFRLCYKRYKFQRKALEDINPQFDHLSIKKAKQFYIQTQYQNASPARQEEPGFTHKYIARNKLIPFFIKTAFNEKVDSERFFLILADSGMGKTTFMVNLYLRYTAIYHYSRRFEMKLFRFSNRDTIDLIKTISNNDANRTILLLDALDEDLGVISTDPNISDTQAFKIRVDEIIEITKNFREVVITCRTQYFPGQEEDPYELKIKRPDEKGFYILNKIYISPFNDKEVNAYLNKKFGIIPFVNQKKKKRALKVISQAKNLVMRPMLLSYIDYLIEDGTSKTTTYNIYVTLVSKWLEREADKRKGLANRNVFMENLYKLSAKTAIAIYFNWINEGRMFLSKEEAIKVAKLFDIHLKAEEVTGQSLLTCDGTGNWKFAHKSILEFFLASEAIQNPKFLKDVNLKGMDMARKFYQELDPGLIFIDHSTKSKLEIPPELDVKYDFYIYDFPIIKHEKGFILQFEMIADSDVTHCWTFKNAVSCCNEVNRKYGYSDVYDNDFNFLDPEGNKVTSVDKVRGFRLPTLWELRTYCLYKQECIYSALAENNTKFYSTYLSPLKISIDAIVSDTNPQTKKNLREMLQLQRKEWCYDESGLSAVGFFRIKLGKETGLEEDTVQGISVHKVSGVMHPFRLVFVP